MRGRERVADAIAGQTGRQRRKAFVRSLEETAVRAVVTASVTFAVGWVLKRMFEQSVIDAATGGARDGVDKKVAEATVAPDAKSTITATAAQAQPTVNAEADSGQA